MLRFNIWFALTDYYKMRQIWLQNVLAILLQNARRPYYKMRQVFYYKTQQFYYKIGLLLQIATTLLQNASYYKMSRLLQIATIQYVIGEKCVSFWFWFCYCFYCCSCYYCCWCNCLCFNNFFSVDIFELLH